MEANDDVTFCATVDFFTVFPFLNTFVDEAAFKTGGGRRRGTTDAAFAADDDATTREDLLLPEEAVIFSLSLSKIMCATASLFVADFVLILKNFCKEAVFFCFMLYWCGYVYVNLDFKRVNVEYACGTLNH